MTDYPRPETVDNQTEKTVSAVFGEIVWLMTQSKEHQGLTIGTLETSVMPAVLLRQFRLFYHEAQPAAAVIYARISPEVQARLRNEGEAAKLSFDEWQSGNNVWIVQVISPFGFGDPFMVETLQTLSAARPDASTPAGMS